MQGRVIAERNRRGWSVRTAAAAGGISNTAWGRFEASGHLTPKMQRAIAAAFDWSTDWPEHPPLERSGQRSDGDDRVSRLAAEVERLAQVVALLAAEARDRIGAESELAERLAALEAGTARRPSA